MRSLSSPCADAETEVACNGGGLTASWAAFTSGRSVVASAARSPRRWWRTGLRPVRLSWGKNSRRSGCRPQQFCTSSAACSSPHSLRLRDGRGSDTAPRPRRTHWRCILAKVIFRQRGRCIFCRRSGDGRFTHASAERSAIKSLGDYDVQRFSWSCPVRRVQMAPREQVLL